MATEIALSVVLLSGTGLLLHSFWNTLRVNPGFDPSHVAIARLDLSAASYKAQQADSYCLRFREQLERQPGVSAVAYSDYLPLSVSAGSWEDLQVRGYVPSPSENMKIYCSLTSPGYFDVLKIPIVEGRDFTLHDDAEEPPVMNVNQEFVAVSGWNHVGRDDIHPYPVYRRGLHGDV